MKMETRDSAGHGSGFKAFPLPPRAGLRDVLCPPNTKVGTAPCPAAPKRGSLYVFGGILRSVLGSAVWNRR